MKPGPPARRATHADGSWSVAGRRCTFTFRRLRPGALLITIAGDDDGSLANAALDEIDAELDRYQALDLFVDASAVAGVAPEVRDAWTRFFTARRGRLRRVTVLAPAPLVHLAVSAAKVFSRTGDMMRVHQDAAAFRDDLGAAGDPDGAGSDPSPLPSVERRVRPDGSVRLEAKGLVFEVRRPRAGVVHLIVSGHDGGQMGNAGLDEVTAALERETDLFLDARDASVASRITEGWTAWIKAQRSRIRRFHALAPKPLRLALSIEKQMARAGDWFHLYERAEEFDAALARATGPNPPR